MQIEHFEWMRTHRARFDLSSSSMSPINPDELKPTDADALSLVAEAYDASLDEVALVHGTQEGNFLSLIAIRKAINQTVGFLPEYEPIRVLASALNIPTLTARHLEDPLPRSSALVISNPNNPTGRYIDMHRLEELSGRLQESHSYAIVDSVFSDFVKLKIKAPLPNVIFTGSTSKFYTMSGVKLGWVIAEKDIIREVKGYADLISPGPFDLELRYAAMALSEKREFESRNADIISKNERALANLSDVIHIPGMPIAFVASRCSVNSLELASRLLDADVMTVPGRYFGVESGVRIGLGSVKPEDFMKAIELVSSVIEPCVPQTSAKA